MREGKEGKLARMLSGIGKGAVALTALATSYAYSPKANADVYVRTVPQQSEWVADGVTEYKVDVLADTTEETGVGFTASEWALWIPAGLNYVRAELPDEVNNPGQNQEDFFYNHLMVSNPGGFFNWVYSEPIGNNGNTTWPTKIMQNLRATDNSNVGPENVLDKKLGTYVFTVNPSAVTGNRGFLTSNHQFVGNQGVGYSLSCTGGGCSVQTNSPFTIVAPEIPGDMDMNGVVDMNDKDMFIESIMDPEWYSSQRGGGATIGNADMNGDGNIDARDTQGFIDALIGN